MKLAKVLGQGPFYPIYGLPWLGSALSTRLGFNFAALGRRTGIDILLCGKDGRTIVKNVTIGCAGGRQQLLVPKVPNNDPQQGESRSRVNVLSSFSNAIVKIVFLSRDNI